MASSRARKTPLFLPDRLGAEELAFRRLRPSLVKKYRGEFVALLHGRVVGHGSDDETLAQELFAKLGDAPFYIAKVEDTPTVCELPSPESIR